jgi:glycosyltransferase involved in cell wall biosynthesis
MSDKQQAPAPENMSGTVCTLSVIVPVYNEEVVLPAFHRRLVSAIEDIEGGFEIIYIDDGSKDRSVEVLQEMRAADSRVGILRLSRNFGKEQAVSAGLHRARGASTVVIDADLQDPPELIPSMVEAWREGADVVNMRRRSRQGEHWLKKATAHAFYRVINRMSEVEIPEDTGDFRLFSRRATDALNEMPERNRFMKGLFAWIGFTQKTIDYDRDPRAAGISKWRYWQLWNFALEGITGFSIAPLKVATYIGFLTSLGAFAYALYFLFKALFYGDPVQGFPTLIIAILLLGGLQLMATGVIGEYLGRLFLETKRRPLYLVQDFCAPATSASAEEGKAAAEHANDV